MSSVPERSEVEEAANHKIAESKDDAASSHVAKGKTVIAGAMVTGLLVLCFFLLFWNHFVGLRSGEGGFTSGVYFLKGIMPYRDYYSPVPPLFMLRSAAALALFGKLPIVIRGLGVFERILLGLLLYGWLVRFFRVRDAAWAAVVTVILSAGDYADPVSSYNHFTILMAMASGFVASYALDEGRTERALVAIGGLAGLLSLLCMATKQTIGLGVTVGIPMAVGLCLIRVEGVRKAIRFVGGFAAGWMVGAGGLLGWMAHYDILGAFLKQTFVTGPAAKGTHLGDFVVRTFAVMEGYWWQALLAVVILALGFGALRRSEKKEKAETTAASLIGILVALLLGLAAVEGSTMATWQMLGFLPNQTARPTIYVSLFGSGVLTFYYVWRCLSGRLSRRQAQFALFATIAFIVAFMTSLSFPAFEAMIVPGLGLVLALLLNDYDGWRRWVVYAVCTAMLFCTALFKEGMPFGFNAWYEPPVKAATQASSLPELKGFLWAPETVDFVDSTVRIIRENSTENDTIFIYPELGFFYGVTERRSATFSGSHNLDTVPDGFAREEAKRLLRVRPAVLIYGQKSPDLLRADEITWRNGKPSGQRDLIAAVETLAQEYRLVRTFRLYPLGEPVYVFVRPDAGVTQSITPN